MVDASKYSQAYRYKVLSEYRESDASEWTEAARLFMPAYDVVYPYKGKVKTDADGQLRFSGIEFYVNGVAFRFDRGINRLYVEDFNSIAIETYDIAFEVSHRLSYQVALMNNPLWWDGSIDDLLKRNADKNLEEIHEVYDIPKTHLHEQAYQRLRQVRNPITTGYVYLLKGVGYDPPVYKIGMSEKPVKRIEKLGVKLPFPLDVMHLIASNNHSWAESKLHERYADKRTSGEWFFLTDEDVCDICAIERMDDL